MSSGEFLSLALLNHMLCYFTPSNIPKNKEEQNWNLTTGKNNIVFLYLQNIDDLTKSCNFLSYSSTNSEPKILHFSVTKCRH